MMIHHVVLINTEDLLMPPIITRARTRVVWSSGRGRLVESSPEHLQSKATNQRLAGRSNSLSRPSLSEMVQPGSLVWLHLSGKVNDKKGLDPTDNCWGVLVVWRGAALFDTADCWLLLITDSLVMIPCPYSPTCLLWKLSPAHKLAAKKDTRLNCYVVEVHLWNYWLKNSRA